MLFAVEFEDRINIHWAGGIRTQAPAVETLVSEKLPSTIPQCRVLTELPPVDVVPRAPRGNHVAVTCLSGRDE